MAEATIVELKARAYDVIGQIEQMQNILKNINSQIASKMQEEVAKKDKKEDIPA